MTLTHARAASAVAVITALLTGHLTAQTVQGVVVSEKSQVTVGNARLSLLDDSGHVAATTTSDSATGSFFLDVPKAGRYRLEALIGRGGRSFSAPFTVDTNQTVEHKFAIPEWPKEVLEAYLPDDVTKQAAYLPAARSAPRYPDALRAKHRAGVVRALVVVDRNGQPVKSTLRIIQSDDELFDEALRDYLDRARFVPAERDGEKVSQIFELGIDFGFGTEPPHLSGNNVIVVRALAVIRRLPP